MLRAEFLRGKILYLPEGIQHEFAPGEWMMRYDEEPIIRASVREICKRHQPKAVLEVGFGVGFTATMFEEMGVKRHIIVEPHPQLFEDAQVWRKQFPKSDIVLVNEFIQDYKSPEQFDVIYDDRYELVDKIRGIEWEERFRYKKLATCYTFPENMAGSDTTHGFFFQCCNLPKSFQPIFNGNA